MSVARSIAYNTIVQVAGKMLSTIFGVIIVAWMTRQLGPDGFGVYSAATAYLQIFALVLDLGLNVTFVAMLGEKAGDAAFEKRCVSAIFTLRLLMSCLILGVAPLVWYFLFPTETSMTLIITALTGAYFFPALNQVVIGVQQRHLKMTAAAIGENIGRVTMIIGLVFADRLHWGLVPIMLLVSLGSALNFFFNIWQARRLDTFSLRWDPAFWKQALSRSWPIGLSIAFNLVYFKADTLVLSRVRPIAETGLYGAAYRVLEILVTIPFIYAGIILPLLSKTWAQKKYDEFKHIISRSIDLMMLLICPLVAGAIAIGPELMSTISGPAFRESGVALQILILAVGMIYLNTIFSHAVVAINVQKRMMPVYAFVAAVTLGGYLIFIPIYGMYAAAWLTVMSELLIGIGNVLVTTQSTKIYLNWRPSFAAIVSSLAMGIMVYNFRTLWLPIPLLLGATIYTALVLMLGGVDKKTIKSLIGNKA